MSNAEFAGREAEKLNDEIDRLREVLRQIADSGHLGGTMLATFAERALNGMQERLSDLLTCW